MTLPELGGPTQFPDWLAPFSILNFPILYPLLGERLVVLVPAAEDVGDEVEDF